MQSTGSLLLAALVGMVLLLLFLALAVAISRTLKRKPVTGSPLISNGGGQFESAGKRIKCAHCGKTEFKEQEILLNTWLLSLLRIDWLDSSATALTCKSCGNLSWFSKDTSS